MIVVGIGVTPNVELARSCRLNVDNGILVNRHLLSSDDHLRRRDVANAYHPLCGCREPWHAFWPAVVA